MRYEENEQEDEFHIRIPRRKHHISKPPVLIQFQVTADAIDFFGKRYSYLRQFVPLLLQTLTLRAQGPDDTVLRAVEVIRDLDRVPTRRPVPKDAPMALVTDAWRPYIREPDGDISRRYYELCTLWHLRSALRSGRVWVEHSRWVRLQESIQQGLLHTGASATPICRSQIYHLFFRQFQKQNFHSAF